jgi:hypothetical protein
MEGERCGQAALKWVSSKQSQESERASEREREIEREGGRVCNRETAIKGGRERGGQAAVECVNSKQSHEFTAKYVGKVLTPRSLPLFNSIPSEQEPGAHGQACGHEFLSLRLLCLSVCLSLSISLSLSLSLSHSLTHSPTMHPPKQRVECS